MGFENSALSLFRSAKSSAHGSRCVLECPSVHYGSQTYGSLTAVGKWFVGRIDARKREEIELADHIVVLSRFAARTFTDAGVSPERIEVIPLGVDCEFFCYSPFPDTSKGVRFLFVGAATYWKGVDLLIDAFSKVSDGSHSLRFVGVTTPLLMNRLRDSSNISTAGPVSRSALRREYGAAHILVLPSRFDGFGMVVSEALATGRPVIVSDHVGAADIVNTEGPNQSGWVVQANNVDALADAMREAIRKANSLEYLGKAGRHAMEFLSWDHYGEKVASFYMRVAGKLKTS
jgi:Glycosyltransferase